ncbi:unnamed protein product [Sphagnum jensenii]|uniref:Glycosyltransferase 61 catalytic domain-containing protein n=1 Tax=Sphagnum jensenii TaxID=128206 RepID=A0ABP0VP90_9BRYO
MAFSQMPQTGCRGGGVRKRCWLRRVVAALVLLNVGQLIVFFLHAGENGDNELPNTMRQSPGKQWPQLRSFTLWTAKPDLDLRSCEALFGNGFTQPFYLLEPESRPRLRRAKHRGFTRGRSAFGFILARLVGAWTKLVLKQAVHAAEGLNNSSRFLNGTEGRAVQRLDRNRRLQPQHDGLFQCFRSPVLHTSVCEGTHMVMYPKKIKMSKGGERLNSVMERNAAEELPYFTSGAFQVMVPENGERRPLLNKKMLDRIMPQGDVREHTLHHLLEQIRTIPLDEVTCAQRVSQPTLVVTRFEHMNLFHTITDWYSAYMTARVVNLKRRPRLLFVDGHCQSPMDDGWQAMFSGMNFARHLTGPVCFDHLIFAPLGYDTPLFRGQDLEVPCTGNLPMDADMDSEHRTGRLREFGEMFTASFNLSKDTVSTKDITIVKVLFVRQEEYVAYPQHLKRPEFHLRNEEEVFEALMTWATIRSRPHAGQQKLSLEESRGKLNITITNGLLSHMSMQEQLQIVQESAIIIGAHGAGLSHLLFARPGKTAILELTSPDFQCPDFQKLAQWNGIQYHAMELEDSVADCSEVMYYIDFILNDLIWKEAIP